MSDLLKRALAGESLSDIGIVDVHGHLGRIGFTIPDFTAASMVRVMDRLGVASTICSHMQCMSAEAERGNREVHDAMQAFPGRILGYVIVSPFAEALPSRPF